MCDRVQLTVTRIATWGEAFNEMLPEISFVETKVLLGPLPATRSQNCPLLFQGRHGNSCIATSDVRTRQIRQTLAYFS